MVASLQHQRVVVLSGAGLSKASGIPTFRDADGLWRGNRPEQLATPEAWRRDPDNVRAFYDHRRVHCAQVLPNPAHEALSRLQHALGVKRVTLVTQNVDGLLEKAGAVETIEMHGSLWRLRCEASVDHPRVGVYGAQDPNRRCALCKAKMRPDVVWFGEVPEHLDRIASAVQSCDVFVSVGTSGVVYPAAGLVDVARDHGAWCVEVNPEPSGGRFDEVFAGNAEDVLPELVARWLDEA